MLEVGPMELLDLQKQKQNYIFGDNFSEFQFHEIFLHTSACKKILVLVSFKKK